MRKNKFVLTVDQDEYDFIIYSMIEMKNSLLREGRYTDVVDDALLKLINCRKKRIIAAE